MAQRQTGRRAESSTWTDVREGAARDGRLHSSPGGGPVCQPDRPTTLSCKYGRVSIQWRLLAVTWASGLLDKAVHVCCSGLSAEAWLERV